ncbi:peptidase, M23 family, partial [Bordetella pertussis H934]
QPKPLDQGSAETPAGGMEAGAGGETGGATTPPAATVPDPKPARAADAAVINWGWPANGAILQTFNSNTKGIDLAGSLGDPVIAAADGKVMYSGNGVRGLGNLIIINHQNGFITAYAHNRALLVKTGQNVKRGAKIAEIGETDTTSPRLHFEIRRQGTPVDPMQYLPPR